jgi:hypothetical protein
MRLAHFQKNVGWGEVIKTFLVALLAAGFAVINPEPPYSLVVVTLALCLPALFRKVLTGDPGFWSSVLARLALALVAMAFVMGFFRDRLVEINGIATALFSVLALYSSAFFWLWSDPEVVRLDNDS